jgi:hypothetical protein
MAQWDVAETWDAVQSNDFTTTFNIRQMQSHGEFAATAVSNIGGRGRSADAMGLTAHSRYKGVQSTGRWNT